MSERLDAERVTDIMNACFDRLGKVVFEFEGYIDKFMGDCIMALFGAPVAHENDPELAVRCAIRLLTELEAFNREADLQLKMSIGINSGYVIAGSVGTERKREYTVMGDAVNLAQRLQSHAEPQQILVSRAIYKSCERLFSFKPLDRVQVKGKREEIELYEVLRNPSLEAPQDDTRILQLKTFIGRKRELEIAKHCLETLRSGQGQILAVCGEPGVGKSRLKLEVKNIARDSGILWYESKCFLLTKETGYHSFKELLLAILGSEKRDPEFISKSLKRMELDSASEYLIRDLIGFPDASIEPLVLDAAKKKKAIFTAVKKLFVQLSTHSKVVLYFEDLHWMDSLSLELLHYCLPLTSSHSLMIYGSFRSDFQHEWGQNGNFNQISLQALTPAESVDLAKELLDLPELPESLATLIQKRSDGNPLYIEEIVKTLIESESIQRIGQKWVVGSDLDRLEIPSTVQGIIASRIDKLDDSEKLILQYASVIGREFSLDLLDEALGGYPGLESTLGRLKKRELIHERVNDSGESSFIFKHALTQEVAYQSILKKKRRVFHEQVALSLEHRAQKAGEVGAQDFVEMLALHFQKAEVTSKAAHYLSLAGDKLKNSFSHTDAIKHFRAAIEVIENDPDAQDLDPKLILKLLYDVAFLYMKSDPDLSEKYFQSILVHPEASSDPMRKARAFRAISEIKKNQGHFDEAIDWQQKSLEVSISFDDFEGQIRTYKTMGNTLRERKENSEKALEILNKGLEGARKIEKSVLVAEFLNDISILLIELNRLDQAETYLDACLDLAKKEKQLAPVQLNATINKGVIHYYRKDYMAALKSWEESTALAKKMGDLKNVMISAHNVGEVLREFEKFEEAIQSFETSYTMAVDLGFEPWQINNLVLIGYLKTKLGKSQEGQSILEDAIRRAQIKKLWLYYCDGLFYLGQFHFDAHDSSKAKEAWSTGRAKACELKLEQMVNRFDEALAKAVEPTAKNELGGL